MQPVRRNPATEERANAQREESTVLIGQRITITDAKNRTLIGKTGTVIDETKHTITIKTPTKEFTIIKDQIITMRNEHG